LPVFIPLEQASKQVRATATVVSELLVAIEVEGLQQEKSKSVHGKIVDDDRRCFFANRRTKLGNEKLVCLCVIA